MSGHITHKETIKRMTDAAGHFLSALSSDQRAVAELQRFGLNDVARGHAHALAG